MHVDPPSSFPYMRVAKRYGVSYAVVLWVADQYATRWPSYYPMPYHVARDFPSNSTRWHLEPWATATCAAWHVEHARRRQAKP